MRVLLVEDDVKIASFIIKGLRSAGYAVDHAPDGAAFPIRPGLIFTQVHGLKNIYVHSQAVALFRPCVWALHVDNFHRTVLIVFPGRWGRFRAS